ncbi:Cytochrome c oxidase assembly factor 3, mitochondrial, partial [Pseudolycoriella hygida]
ESSFKIQEPGRKLKPAEADFMKLIEKENLIRVQKLQSLRKRNNLTGIILGGSVLSIYFYSMFAVKQEKFLDDFSEPVKVSNE